MEVKKRMNRCGECNVCCDTLSIYEIKDAHTVCEHYDQRCNIYNDRPDACRNFECEYIKRNWNIRLRPDKCGIIIYNDIDKRYYVLRLQDDVDSLIMEQIEFIKKEPNVIIKIMDKRRKINGSVEGN